ncbi:MAG: flagellar motor protein MotA [Candidatus Omnitrophica bacterium CG11_big_fil_rev_8_21_14_0_20_64_10]|nr:MAG: flagellar motor protein MotA [Candidatus Omnitrophica bacterium CG11_big_fil_rev_8_21_14_0_20_64_10]
MLLEWMSRGGPVMVPLLICSVIALTIVTERFLFWTRWSAKRDPEGVQKILDHVRRGELQKAIAAGWACPDPVAKILTKGLEQGRHTLTGALEIQVQAAQRQMRQYLGVLETLITLAPLLGIYGTITGIIRSFGFLGGSGVPDPQLVASGIAEALITTAAGLTIAIAAIPPYNFFSAKTESLLHDVERQATTLELVWEGGR